MPAIRGERGQASVELVALLPLLVALGFAVWQAAVAGQAMWLAGSAAGGGGRGEGAGGEATAAGGGGPRRRPPPGAAGRSPAACRGWPACAPAPGGRRSRDGADPRRDRRRHDG